jgi:hypothetical protein
MHEHMSGERKYVPIQYHCQTCGHDFIPEEREFCDAPPVGTQLIAQKIQRLAEAKKLGEHLRPKDKAAAEAVAELIAPTQDPWEAYDEFKRIETQIIGMYADECYALKQKNPPEAHDLTQEEFVEKHLILYEIKRIPKPDTPRGT